MNENETIVFIEETIFFKQCVAGKVMLRSLSLKTQKLNILFNYRYHTSKENEN